MSGRRDDRGNGDTGQHVPLRVDTIGEYRAMLDDIDQAWAKLTDVERLELEAETKRRRADNPNWPFIGSDHADRMIQRIRENTTAVHTLEEAITGPDGMVLRMRASTSAIDLMREELERHTTAMNAHTEATNANTLAQDLLRMAIERLAAALGAGVQAS